MSLIQDDFNILDLAKSRDLPLKGRVDGGGFFVPQKPIPRLIPNEPLQDGEQYRFHFDMSRCIGCQCCVVACNERNNNPADVNWRRVGEIEDGQYPLTKRHHLSMACNHCLDPSCLTGTIFSRLHRLDSEPENQDGQSRCRDDATGQGVTPAFEPAPPERFDPTQSEQGHPDHRADRDHAEHHGGSHRPVPATAARRQHEQRDQRFAGPEYENQKERPKGSGLSRVVVTVFVVCFSMAMQVDSISVSVRDIARRQGPCPPQTPSAIRETENDHRPGREAPANQFQGFDVSNCRAGREPESSE